MKFINVLGQEIQLAVQSQRISDFPGPGGTPAPQGRWLTEQSPSRRTHSCILGASVSVQRELTLPIKPSFGIFIGLQLLLLLTSHSASWRPLHSPPAASLISLPLASLVPGGSGHCDPSDMHLMIMGTRITDPLPHISLVVVPFTLLFLLFN